MGFGDFMFGKSPELKFKQSPQQANMYGIMEPIFRNFMGGNFPQMYDLPTPVGPTSDWYNNIAPEVRQSLWEPAQEAGHQMMEVMGSKGQVGSPGSPISGSAATGLGRMFADYGQGIGRQAWDMMQPGMMADYGAQLQRSRTGYQTSLMPFQTAAGMLPGTYGSPTVMPGSQGFLGSMMQMAMPFGMSHLPWGNFGGMFGGANRGFGGGMMLPGMMGGGR